MADSQHPTPLRARLEKCYQIPPEAGRLLDRVEHEVVEIAADSVVINRSERNTRFLAVESGWLYRYRQSQDGSRQVVTFILPGDLINPDAAVVTSMDYGVRTLTDVTLRKIEKQTMGRLLESAPTLIAGLWWTSVQEKGMLQAQVVRLGRERAVVRVGSLLLELHHRLLMVESAIDQSCYCLPLTQRELADALGLSSVHVSRVFSDLRKQRLIRTRRGEVELIDRDKLVEFTTFDPAYFHLESSAAESLFT